MMKTHDDFLEHSGSDGEKSCSTPLARTIILTKNREMPSFRSSQDQTTGLYPSTSRSHYNTMTPDQLEFYMHSFASDHILKLEMERVQRILIYLEKKSAREKMDPLERKNAISRYTQMFKALLWKKDN